MKNKPAMRDGTTGYEWHALSASGIKARCQIHLLRDSEDSAMDNDDMGGPNHVRHKTRLDIYLDTNAIRKEIIERAGGPLACTSQLGRVNKIPGLVAYITQQINSLTRRVQGALDMAPPDSVTVTITPYLTCSSPSGFWA